MIEKYDPEPRRKALADFIKREKLAVQPWTARAGLSESSVRHFLKGRTDSLGDSTYEQLARAASLIKGRPIPAAELRGELIAESVPMVATTGIIRFGRLREPAPVVGDLAEFALSQAAQGWAPRPPHGPRDLYSFKMPSESMEPWRELLDPVYFQMNTDAPVGSYVILEGEPSKRDDDQDYREVVLGRVVDRDPHRWVLRQYNPQEDIEVLTSSVKRVHRVVDWPELIGFRKSPDEEEAERKALFNEFRGNWSSFKTKQIDEPS